MKGFEHDAQFPFCQLAILPSLQGWIKVQRPDGEAAQREDRFSNRSQHPSYLMIFSFHYRHKAFAHAPDLKLCRKTARSVFQNESGPKPLCILR